VEEIVDQRPKQCAISGLGEGERTLLRLGVDQSKSTLSSFIQIVLSCTCFQEQGAVLDDRSKALGGETGWVRNNIEIFTHSSTMTSHDWLVVLSQAGPYVLHEVFNHARRDAALSALLLATTVLIEATSPADVPGCEEDLEKVRRQLIEAACLMESVLPKTELAPLFHILMHVPDMIYRWNHVRNFWCFFGERYVLVPFGTFRYLLVPFGTFWYLLVP
jgi:hypothetical protein